MKATAAVESAVAPIVSIILVATAILSDPDVPEIAKLASVVGSVPAVTARVYVHLGKPESVSAKIAA